MRKSLSYTFHAGVLVIIFAAIVLIVYLIALNHNTLWDLTKARENTLDPKTIGILDSLDFDVEIKVFEKEGQEQKNARNLLELYVIKSKHITFETIDPDVQPGLAEQCGVERYGQAVIYGKGRSQRIEQITEESTTSALLKLLRDKKKVVYFVTGHGEKGLDDDQKQGLSGLRDALMANNYMVKSCFLIREPSVPADADLVILAGPRKELFPEEQGMLSIYLEQGGRMFVALEPEHDAGMRNFLEKWGIEIDSDIIIDTFSRILGGDYTCPVVNMYGDVKGLRGFGYTTFYPTARSLRIVDDRSIGLNVEWLVRTSDQSWSEHDLKKFFELGEATFDGPDIQGPLNIALLARKKIKEEIYSQIMVFGDADFITNNFLMVSGNKDLVMNCMNMLLGEDSLIVIAPKSLQQTPFILTPSQGMLVFWVPIVGLPMLIIIIAVLRFWLRRKA